MKPSRGIVPCDTLDAWARKIVIYGSQRKQINEALLMQALLMIAAEQTLTTCPHWRRGAPRSWQRQS